MRDLPSASGAWTGFWDEHGFRGHMGLRLHFRAGRVDGVGSDEIGRFSMTGGFSETGSVNLLKKYPTHTVSYRGQWDGQMIAGEWSMGHGYLRETGPFEMWPESGETLIEQLQEAEPETLALPARGEAGPNAK
jgi:hypothetical protein